ncbi:hypothetical protein G7Y89_g10612 [Cudoniella acicularis]|uniref:2EXR domain-containing protein n=1 Tax=Cudoniella acicularis TaxID=354080 RepID=A0A8H4RER2_9HELO|nr:hypothetical protein G7Y89_g10612 [Cudoniella acicularis]
MLPTPPCISTPTKNFNSTSTSSRSATLPRTSTPKNFEQINMPPKSKSTMKDTPNAKLAPIPKLRGLLTKFKPFPKLPFDLRVMIWKLNLPAPRHVNLAGFCPPLDSNGKPTEIVTWVPIWINPRVDTVFLKWQHITRFKETNPVLYPFTALAFAVPNLLSSIETLELKNFYIEEGDTKDIGKLDVLPNFPKPKTLCLTIAFSSIELNRLKAEEDSMRRRVAK